jgi:hypothetical protein
MQSAFDKQVSCGVWHWKAKYGGPLPAPTQSQPDWQSWPEEHKTGLVH